MPQQYEKEKLYQSLLAGMFQAPFFRFCVVGGFGSLINYLTFLFFLFQVGLEYRIAGAIGFLVPVPIVFFINRNWTFQSDAKTSTALPVYVLTNLTALCGHAAAQYCSHEWLGVPKVYSQILGIAASTAINYFLARKVVFR